MMKKYQAWAYERREWYNTVIPSCIIILIILNLTHAVAFIALIHIVLSVSNWNYKNHLEQTKQKETIEKKDEAKILKNKNKQACDDMLTDILTNISGHLKFSMDERICIYILLREKDKHFHPVTRYSKNGLYRLPGRLKYPFLKKGNEPIGVLGHVWIGKGQDDFYEDRQFPEVKGKDEKDYVNYVHKKYGISKTDIQGFRMKPKEMMAHIIREEKGGKGLGVIVFESKRAKFLSGERIKNAYNTEGRSVAIASLLVLYKMNYVD